MRKRDVNAAELTQLADILHAIASIASPYPARTAVESAAATIAGEIARMPAMVDDIVGRTGLPRDLIWKMATPSLGHGDPGAEPDDSEWIERLDAILRMLVRELLGRNP